MSNIQVIEEYPIMVHMFLIPKIKKVHFTNLEDSDEESSETYKKMTKLIESKEMDIPLTIYISKINDELYMGIEFQNGKVIYRKIQQLEYKHEKIYRDMSTNVAFIPSDRVLTLCSTVRCYTCHGMFKKIYRCFDCFPKSEDAPSNTGIFKKSKSTNKMKESEKKPKKQNKYDFCKACYKRRDHTNHRIIAIVLDNDTIDKYPILEE